MTSTRAVLPSANHLSLFFCLQPHPSLPSFSFFLIPPPPCTALLFVTHAALHDQTTRGQSTPLQGGDSRTVAAVFQFYNFASLQPSQREEEDTPAIDIAQSPDSGYHYITLVSSIFFEKLKLQRAPSTPGFCEVCRQIQTTS